MDHFKSRRCSNYKAGKGISHSEKLKKGSEIFQIWFDPNIQESLYIDPKL